MSLFLVLLGGSHQVVRGNYVVSIIDRHMKRQKAEESSASEFVVDEGVGHSRYLRLDIRTLREQVSLAIFTHININAGVTS